HPGDDQEIDDRGDEGAIGEDRRPGLARGGEAGELAVAEVHEEVGEVDPAGDDADDRVDQIGHQAGDDGGEGRADDDAHGHVHDIALGDEGFKFVQHLNVILDYTTDCRLWFPCRGEQLPLQYVTGIPI